MSFLVVGDIHGSVAQLEMLLDLYGNDRRRRMVFLGDYVDIGPQSCRVIELLINLRAADDTALFLKGNHDIALMTYLKTRDFVSYASNGGIATIRSYCGELHGDVYAGMLASVPASHKDFLSTLDDFFETPEYLFSHAGYDPESPLDRSEQAMVITSHQDLFGVTHYLDKLSVCGHYFQRSHRPFLRERFICLDTGCGMVDGPLTGLFLPEQHIIQVWPDRSVSHWTC